jgi:FkbM family methyltransferase
MYFDIGANIGRWSLANLNNCKKIIAVEASPTTFTKLVNNTLKKTNIICLNYAVSSSNNEFIDFYNCNSDTLSTTNKD